MGIIREASLEDLPQILDSLRALSTVEYEKYEDVVNAFKEREMCGNIITFVYEEKGEIWGTATLILERKLSHGGKLAAHIEDVAVNKKKQLKGVGSALVEHCIQYAKALNAIKVYYGGCYKVSLRCKQNLKSYYQNLGFDDCEVIELRKDL